jgi:O-succinylbenzoic acid--CoA ligase
MLELVAVESPGAPTFVDTMLRIWDAGDAVLPVDPRLPAAGLERLYGSLRPTVVIDADGRRHRRADGVPVLEGDAVVIATSGSTGTPKGVVHTHTSVAASARATNAGIGVDPARDRWLCCLPISHVAGLSVITRALISGTSLQVLASFDADMATAAALAGATLTTLVPTALARIDPRLFRRIVVGGTFPPDPLPGNCLVSYGLTETGSAIAYDGRALDGVEIEIVDGDIRLRGDMLLRAYRTDEPEGRVPLDADGWFATGDAGEWADDGSFVVHGRRGEMIITGGENVWPVEVERVLERHPGIAEVAVIGRPDPEWGHRVVAVVVPTTNGGAPTLDELRAATKTELPAFAAPRSIEVVDHLPRTSLGKVARSSL